MQCTAIFQKHGAWYLGWVEEIPGINTQGKTLNEAKTNLREALVLVLETNRLLVERERPRGRIIKQRLAI